MRAAAWLAIGGQLAFIASWIVAAALEPRYSDVHDYVSELGAKSAAHPWIVNTGIAVLGLSIAVLGPALVPTLRRPLSRVSLAALFVIAGVATGLDSVFRLFVGDGCRRVIAFNGDTPHLPPDTLAGAFPLLARHDLVVGPTEDGGYYLVGARGAHGGLFAADGLGTGGALRALLARAAERGLGVALTEAWYDVDEGSDLARLGAELRRTPARAPRTAAWLAAWNGRTP